METDQTSRNIRQTSKIEKMEREYAPYEKSYHSMGKLVAIVIILCFSSFYFGFNLTAISSVNLKTNILSQYYGEHANNSAVIGGLIGALPVGACVGALIAPIFMSYFSRKSFILFFNAVAIFFCGLIQINNIIILLICKIFQGIIVGNFMAMTPIYINELAPLEVQGQLGAFTQLFVVIAQVLSYMMGVIFVDLDANPNFVWRYMFSFTGITIVIQSLLLIFNFVPESPVSLVKNKDYEGATKVLAMFLKEKHVEKVLNELIEQSQFVVKNESAVRKDLIENEEYEEKASETGNATVPKESTSIKALLLGFELPFMQQFCGINMIITEIGSIVSSFDQDLGIYSPLIANIIQVFATAFSVYALSMFGRRGLILFGNFSLGILDIIMAVMFLLVYVSGFKQGIYIVLGCIFLFMISYGVTIGPAVWLYVPEIIPAKMVPPATFMNWLGCSICVIATPFITNAVGSPYPVFFIFGGVTILFGLINWFNVIETKGLTTGEIKEKFK